MLWRGGLFLLIWWALTDGATNSWWIGVPAVLLALMSSAMLLPPIDFVWYQFLRFVPFFLMYSLRGGIDVAWRAFHPRMPIYPDLVEYPIRLPPGLPRVFLANTVNLLPGTLSAALEQNIMKIHVLDSRQNFLAELESVEQSVARIFGIPLNTPRGDK
ncbi:MAG: Na+/H+ antiporter subunit E [Gammaproteobacteria bacterium]